MLEHVALEANPIVSLRINMDIIAHIDVHVKVDIEKEDAFSLRYGNKWEIKKKKAKEVSEKMSKIGEKVRAIRMANCAEIVTGKVCQKCGQMHLQYANLCRDRFCPVCKWRLSMKRFTSMYKIITGLRQQYPEAAWQFVTLTAQNCAPKDLDIMLDEMSRAWNNITTAKKFKRKVAGWARSMEFTYNETAGTLHPHYHILVMYKELEEPDEYIIQRWLKGIKWKTSVLAQEAHEIEFTAEDQMEIGWEVDQNPNDTAAIEAILETYKYTTRDKDVDNMPLGVFRVMVDVLKNRRLVAFGGVIKEYARDLELDRLEDADERDSEEEEREVERCIKCGNSHLVEIIGKWAGDSYIWRREQ